jgi:hypothetical protein
MRFRAVVLPLVALALPALMLELPSCPTLAADVAPRMLKTNETLRGRFVQERQLSGFAKPLRTEGTFILVPGRGLIWRSLIPFQSTTVITPSGILGQTNGQETMRLLATRMPSLGHLYDVLGAAVSGDIDPLQQSFIVKRSETPGGWQLVLTPLHPDNPAMSQIKSLVVSGNRFVDTVEVGKDGGDVDRLHFLDQAIDASPLSPDETSLLSALNK